MNIIYTQELYDEWAEYREKERAVMAKFAPKSKKELRKYRRKVKQGKAIIMDLEDEGFVLPAASVISQDVNFSFSSDNYKSHENQ